MSASKISNGVKIFLDFDNTLVHTKRFFQEVYTPLLIAAGKTHQEIETSYQLFSPGVDPSKGAFTPTRHLEALGIDEEKRRDILQSLLKSFLQERAFIFPDTIFLLENLKQYELYLLTYGQPQYQNMKITASGIREYFQDCLITEGSKKETLIRVIERKEEFIFVDDRKEYFSDLKSEFKNKVYGIHFTHQDTGVTCDGCDAAAHASNAKDLIFLIKNICAA